MRGRLKGADSTINSIFQTTVLYMLWLGTYRSTTREADSSVEMDGEQRRFEGHSSGEEDGSGGRRQAIEPMPAFVLRFLKCTCHALASYYKPVKVHLRSYSAEIMELKCGREVDKA